jgi:hypothetical protein
MGIIIMLEMAFTIRIEHGAFFPAPIFEGNPQYINFQSGYLKKAGIDLLKKNFPFLNLDEFLKKPCIQRLSVLLTVGAIANYVESKIGLNRN